MRSGGPRLQVEAVVEVGTRPMRHLNINVRILYDFKIAADGCTWVRCRHGTNSSISTR